MIGEQLLDLDIDADVDAAMEGDAFALDLLDAAVDEVLLHLEVGNAVAQQAAGLGFALVDMHLMAGAAELLGGGEAGGAGTDDGDLLAGMHRCRLRHDEAQFVSLVGDRLLDGLDRHRCIFEVQRAGFLAGRRADAAGEFGEVVGRMQVADRRFPVVVIDEIVPVRDLVVHRTAGRAVAIGDATVHAAGGLFLHFRFRHRDREFAEMANAIRGRLILRHLAVDFEETRYLAHVFSLFEAVCPLDTGAWKRNPKTLPAQ